ncbi:hypothetical protein [Pseudoruegeria sp. HB172150]|uniref:hypothetical protein n=1 Tax=Pseudoruegeria sp. HB172150 TaxID=2721164 RepID=UPI001555AB41|nr:hypothetical protein [Pseudoruegeria sp. HB172150]
MTNTALSAVLTGDLIASRDAKTGRVDEAMKALANAARDFGEEWDLDLRFTRFRGDGWQVHLADPNYVLDAAIFLIARLRAANLSIDTRLSAGIGTVETLGTNDLSDADGFAFYASGEHLEDLSPRRRLAIAGQGIGHWQAAIIELIDHIAMGWTSAQAEAVALSLRSDFPKHEQIAEILGISRQAVQARMAAAGFSFFETALYAFRTYNFEGSNI